MTGRSNSGHRDAVLLSVLIAFAFAFGVWAHLPMLRVAFDQSPLWQLPLLCAADVAGFVLFVHGAWHYATAKEAPVSAETHYLEVHYNLRPAEPNADDPRYQKKVLRILFLSFMIPWGIDLAASLALRQMERDDFAEAAVTTGQVVRIEKWQATRGVCRFRYHVHCRFEDGDGNQYETVQILCTNQFGDFPDGLPQEVQASLRRAEKPFSIGIAYRADAPYQAWLADLGPGHGFDLHGFSVQLLVGQCFFMFILIFGPMMTSAERGNVVAWRRSVASIPLFLKEAVPMLFEALWLAFLGFMELALFQRVV